MFNSGSDLFYCVNCVNISKVYNCYECSYNSLLKADHFV